MKEITIEMGTSIQGLDFEDTRFIFNVPKLTQIEYNTLARKCFNSPRLISAYKRSTARWCSFINCEFVNMDYLHTQIFDSYAHTDREYPLQCIDAYEVPGDPNLSAHLYLMHFDSMSKGNGIFGFGDYQKFIDERDKFFAGGWKNVCAAEGMLFGEIDIEPIKGFLNWKELVEAARNKKEKEKQDKQFDLSYHLYNIWLKSLLNANQSTP